MARGHWPFGPTLNRRQGLRILSGYHSAVWHPRRSSSPLLGQPERRLRTGSISPQQLQSELDQPGRLCGADPAKVRRPGTGIRQTELRVVKGIEHLAAELQPGVLAEGECEVLLDAEIPIVHARPA